METLKQQIEESLEEATTARYENKVKELTNVLKMFDSWYKEDHIKQQFEKTEKKWPRIN